MRNHVLDAPALEMNSNMSANMCRERAHASISRVTKEGRMLTYCMTVIQQPERARACGSGAKSSADRRPVDPPPVVELRIFEGEGADRTDVTFNYHANFFLFTTLEIARPVAHGRMQPPMPQVPVLTGMPVSGMAYLDRPSLAGYFLFPDLSVRHEGRYRLSFNLYEETKLEKDGDAEPSNAQSRPPMPVAASPDSSFDWRLEVKSAEFTVYSAKKFPGLSESTGLSKMVAEQGCRVRIRRDVRMRRRDGKPSGDYEVAAEDEYARAGRTPTIQDYRERTRSASNESADRQAYPGMERRMSGEYPRPFAHPGSRPQSYLAFGGAAATQYPAPPPRFAQPAPPAPPSYQPPAAPNPPPVQYRQLAQPPPETFNRPPHPVQTASIATPQPPRDSHQTEPQHPSQNPTSHPSRPSDSSKPVGKERIQLAPLLFPKARTQQLPLTSIEEITRLGSSGAPQRLEPATTASTNTFNKRTHQAAFDPKAKAQQQSLFNGKRPEDLQPEHDISENSDGSDDDEPAYLKNMTYKRANGTFHTVLHPPA